MLLATETELCRTPPGRLQVVKRRRMSRIPPAATARALTQEETDKLAKAHKDRLWEIVGRQAPGILKAVRAHKACPPYICSSFSSAGSTDLAL